MYQQIQLKGDESKFFFISDLHYNHDRDFIWGKRSFTSLEESNRTLIDRWNSTCDEESIVFHLGDFIFADSDGSKFRDLLDRLRFKRIYLLTGNHTSGQRQAYFQELKAQYNLEPKTAEVYPLYTKSLDRDVVFLPPYAEVSINFQPLVLCHYPIASHRDMNKGSIHLSGHCHSNYALSAPSTGVGRCLDVGVESFGKPVNLAYVKEFLKNRTIPKIDHHA